MRYRVSIVRNGILEQVEYYDTFQDLAVAHASKPWLLKLFDDGARKVQVSYRTFIMTVELSQ